MKINMTKNEAVSALMDSDSNAMSDECLIRELRQSEQVQVWDIYHRIGDALRSDEMTVDCSDAFMTRLSARLATEPTYLLSEFRPTHVAEATQQLEQQVSSVAQLKNRQIFGRLPRVASGLAATAAVLYFGSPLLVNMTGGRNVATAELVSPTPQAAAPQTTRATPQELEAKSAVVVMRDSRIDAYLIAHQRFSPSLYSTSQFARSVNFATDAGK